MPWKEADVDRFNKGLTPSQKKRWVAIANSVLKNCIGSKKKHLKPSECEAKAVIVANSILKKSS